MASPISLSKHWEIRHGILPATHKTREEGGDVVIAIDGIEVAEVLRQASKYRA